MTAVLFEMPLCKLRTTIRNIRILKNENDSSIYELKCKYRSEKEKLENILMTFYYIREVLRFREKKEIIDNTESLLSSLTIDRISFENYEREAFFMVIPQLVMYKEKYEKKYDEQKEIVENLRTKIKEMKEKNSNYKHFLYCSERLLDFRLDHGFNSSSELYRILEEN